MEKKNPEAKDNEDDFNPEKEIPIEGGVRPPKFLGKAIKNGEENEDLIFKMKGKIYRFRDGEWKERGTGIIKFLIHKVKKKIRFVLRQDKTFKLVANFLISSNKAPLCNLEPFQRSEKMFSFGAFDFSEDEPFFEIFVIKLENKEKAEKFRKAFIKAKNSNKNVKEGKAPEEFKVISGRKNN